MPRSPAPSLESPDSSPATEEATATAAARPQREAREKKAGRWPQERGPASSEAKAAATTRLPRQGVSAQRWAEAH
eukprot:12814673-Alexandrium_andersonii.AAC.1